MTDNLTTGQPTNAESVSQRTRLFANTSWMVISQVVRAAELIFRSVIIARHLGIEMYAVYAVISAFVRPFLEAFNANLGSALIKFGSAFRESDENERFLALIKISYLITSILYLVYLASVTVGTLLLYDVFFSLEDLHLPVLLFAATSGVTLFNLLAKTLLVLHSRFRTNTVVDIVVSLANLLIVTIAVITYPGNLTVVIIAVSLTTVLATAISNLAAFLDLRQELHGLVSARLNMLRGHYREMAGFTFGNTASRAIESSSKSVDVLILGAFASASAVAVYDISKKLATVFFMLKDPITVAAFPQIAEMLAKKQYTAFKRLLVSVYRVLFLPAIAVIVLVALFDESILGLWGKQFTQVGWVTPLTMSRTIIPLLFFWTIPLLLSLGLVRIRFIAVLVSSIIGFGLAFTLAESWEAEGVAFAMLVSVIVNQLILAVAGLRAIRHREREDGTVPAQHKQESSIPGLVP